MNDSRRLLNEIEHGKYLLNHGAGEIWGWETPAGRVRWQRRVRMLTAHIQKSMKVLEIGCGTGYFTKELVKTGAGITAIDVSRDLINVAMRDVRADNVQFVIENAYALGFKDEAFDSIVGSSVLHHLNVDRALSELYRVLRPGGTIFFTEPNMLNPQIAIQKNIPFIKRKLGDSPDETAFFRFILKRKIEKNGFGDITIWPFDFLHPKTPEGLIKYCAHLGNLIEKLPLLKEIAGSLYIRVQK